MVSSARSKVNCGQNQECVGNAAPEITPPEIIYVDSDKVGCDAATGPSAIPWSIYPWRHGPVDCPIAGAATSAAAQGRRGALTAPGPRRIV